MQSSFGRGARKRERQRSREVRDWIVIRLLENMVHNRSHNPKERFANLERAHCAIRAPWGPDKARIP